MVKAKETMSDDLIKVESISITRVELRDPQRAKTALTMPIRQGFNAADSRPPTPRLSNAPIQRPAVAAKTSDVIRSCHSQVAPRRPTGQQTTNDTEVTEDDIDFFLFCTPYILPPQILNEALDDSE